MGEKSKFPTFFEEPEEMSEQLAITGNNNESVTFLDRIKAWGKNPKVAAARNPRRRKIESYNLRCRYGQEPMFDVAMTIAADGVTAHLKNSIEKINERFPVEALAGAASNGQTAWISVRLGNREISIKRRSLKSAIEVLLVPA